MRASIPSKMQALVSNLPVSSEPAISISTKDVPVPKAGEVLVKLRASGLNASDAANALQNRFRRREPVTVGRDYAGIIVAAPSNPSIVGRRVFGCSGDELSLTRDGAMAEYLCVPENAVASMPEKATFIQAGQMGTPYTTAYVALLKAQLGTLQPGQKQQTVLILAATGAVGRAVAQIATARGHRVITTSRGDGMDINITTDPKLSRVGELTGGRGVDVIVDGVGDPALATASLDVLGRGGRCAIITAKGAEGTPINLRQLYTRDQSIVGVFGACLNLEENGRAMQEISELVNAGKITLDAESTFEVVKFADCETTYPKAHQFDGKKYVFAFDE